jgi:hypothetical protein
MEFVAIYKKLKKFRIEFGYTRETVRLWKNQPVIIGAISPILYTSRRTAREAEKDAQTIIRRIYPI